MEGFLIEIEVNGDDGGISPPAGVEIEVNRDDGHQNRDERGNMTRRVKPLLVGVLVMFSA